MYQSRAGGWGYEGSFQIAAAILALQHAKEAGVTLDEKKLALAVDHLASMRVEATEGSSQRDTSGSNPSKREPRAPEGSGSADRSAIGYGYSRTGDPLARASKANALNDSVARLVECEWALVKAGKVTPQTFERTFESFMKHREFMWKTRRLAERGKFPTPIGGGTPYMWFAFFGSMYGTLGLEGVPVGRRQAWGEALREDLMAVVDVDGAWTDVNIPNSPGSKMVSTAMALLSLKNIERAVK